LEKVVRGRLLVESTSSSVSEDIRTDDVESNEVTDSADEDEAEAIGRAEVVRYAGEDGGADGSEFIEKAEFCQSASR
jgi:hypothetical protein